MQTSCLAILVAGLAGQAPDLPRFIKEYPQGATFYYKSPNPDLGPKMLKELLKKENLEHPWFAKREQVFIYVGAQLGDIARDKPKIVREYEAAFADAPLTGRRVIVRALMICGDAGTIKQAAKWTADPKFADVRPELETLVKHLEDPKRKHVRDKPAKEPADLDLLWINFFITGEYAPVSRILDVFDVPNAKENEILKRVAKWSLGSNLQQHPKLVEIVQKNAKNRPEASRKVIDELILTFPKEGKK